MLADKLVLTVDDSRTVRRFLRTLLTTHGCKVEEAASGQEAVRMSTEKMYDLILLDLLLPDLDGIEVLRRIRQKDQTAAIVVLTGMGGIKSATTAVREGADGYITKQDLSVGGEAQEFFYALEQAMEHRAGLVAQKQLQELRADFYSMITHDLRNPTSSILLTLQLLLEESIDPLTENQRELLMIAQNAAEKLRRLVDEFLDFAKIDAGYLRLNPDMADLRTVVEESVRLAELQAQARRQTLTLKLPSEPVTGWVDAERMKRVVENLVSNAVKYTPEGGQITVELNATDGIAELRVSDTGIGIPPEQLPALFQKYYRVSAAGTKGIRGTGLGLLIVKEIVEAHGGTVRAESEGSGKGSTFIVRIPLRTPE